ncbi:putative hydrolase or acyltransferase of alpha/beta superfamily (plasmid) [Hoeflea sp. IMCC20628]|uniref:alpha/beta fold hydrolase n=1 Tax=Hoeflea sp. IMCC20628 TaxID=1620421 RepID=UPI00063BF758|nr:alpha/beta fold hydrolase [Hoeflea sp. IMCC20628]AKI03345.1 putative hydrolase or acyltransferase of alpha/beta superfamily [Hoeflea sp. IMCC20628]
MPRRRPVVLLHGWTMRGSIFDHLVARLPSGFDCHAPDLPGHGAQAMVEPSLYASARTLADLLEAQDLRDVVLVGWSMGAAVVWQYIEQFGADRIAGLMTVDMSPKLGCNADWPHGLIDQGESDLTATTERMISDWRGMTEAIAITMSAQRDGAPGYSRQDALDQILANDPAKMIAMWEALVGMDMRELIGNLPCPLLASCGARSRVYPKSAAEWLAATAPRGRMHVFENSGHSPHLEEPEAFAKTLVEFAVSL